MTDEIRSAIKAEPVLVDCPRGSRDVRIRPAFEVEPGLFAPIESVPWEPAGTIWKITGREGQFLRTVWKGVTTGGTVVNAETRGGIIARLLDAREEFEVTIDQTIPQLFDLGEG